MQLATSQRHRFGLLLRLGRRARLRLAAMSYYSMADCTSVDCNSKGTEPSAKKLRALRSPTKFVTWNCNGFISRSKWNANDLHNLVDETDADVFCFQEVRLKADPMDRGKPMGSEYALVRENFEAGGVFENYIALWSLADSRYSGTLTMIHNRIDFERQDSAAFTTDSAIDLLAKLYGTSRESTAGLPPISKKEPKKKQSSIVSFLTSPPGLPPVAKKDPAKKQSSLSSFFLVKETPGGSSKKSMRLDHHPEGRFHFIRLANIDLIHTYVPNNGMKSESFDRRKKWDLEMRDFICARRSILDEAGDASRPLLWCGDLNVARDYRDGTHWERNNHGVIQEWWLNESKCMVSSAVKEPHRDADNIGMPSFTPGERERFEITLKMANLVDVWRSLHPNGLPVEHPHACLPQWEKPEWTWRGHIGKSVGSAKYQGKGQRLDYFLLSPVLLSLVKSCDILGFGEYRKGLFCGSDHCASILIFSE